MVSTDRRNPLNAKLRAKIDHIQQLSRQLQSSIEQIQEETVDSLNRQFAESDESIER